MAAEKQLVSWIISQGGTVPVNSIGDFYYQYPNWNGGKIKKFCSSSNQLEYYRNNHQDFIRIKSQNQGKEEKPEDNIESLFVKWLQSVGGSVNAGNISKFYDLHPEWLPGGLKAFCERSRYLVFDQDTNTVRLIQSSSSNPVSTQNIATNSTPSSAGAPKLPLRPTPVLITSHSSNATNIQSITTPKVYYNEDREIIDIIDRITSQIKLVAVDLEFDFSNGISLIQVAFTSPSNPDKDEVYVLDVLKKSKPVIRKLKLLLEDGDIAKVMHDCRRDTLVLKFHWKVKLNNVWDTSHYWSEISGEKENIGLNDLLKMYGLPEHEQKRKVQHKDRDGRNVWMSRPLPENLIQYAASDVLYLIKLRDLMMANLNMSEPESEPIMLQFSPKVDAFCSIMPQEIPSDEFDHTFLSLLPIDLHSVCAGFQGKIEELVIDAQRPVIIRTNDDTERILDLIVDIDEALFVLESAMENEDEINWTSDNRVCFSGTLHRVSRILAPDGRRIVGLSYRLGRHIPNCSLLISDIVVKIVESVRACVDVGLLLLGRPGLGKTTLLRQITAMLACEFGSRVMVVDTSSEIAGGGDLPHPCIGNARRFPVQDRRFQHKSLLEVVQNHSPKVIIVDEISTKEEANAIKSIAQRGVAVIGTAHGTSLDNIMKNRDLVTLLGGIHSVILSKDEVIARKAPQKTVQERCEEPAFTMLLEMKDRNRIVLHHDIAKSVDNRLKGLDVETEERWRDSEGVLWVK